MRGLILCCILIILLLDNSDCWRRRRRRRRAPPEPPPLYTGGGIKYQRVGCYLETVRVLRELVITERDPGSSAWNGNWIDWSNWNSYMVGFLNRCAAKVKSKGYKVFAASSYG
eukprot:gene14181-5185_t